MASKSMDKTARREAARAQAEILRNQAQAQERKQRIIIGVIAAVIVVLIAVAGLIIWQSSQRTLFSDFEGEVPAGANDRGGFVVGAEGVGSPNEDAVEVQIYLDYSCVWCERFEEVNGADIAEMTDAGEVTAIYHPVAYLNEYSVRAGAAMAAVADRSPEHLVDFNEQMFATLEPGASDEQIIEVALSVGVPEDVANTITDGTFTEWVQVASDQGRRDGAMGTPTIFVDGTEIDAEQEGQNWLNPGELPEFIRSQA
ncbi:DsbA family protein [Pseudactinotalea sp. Z1748]|uniref:DsbA family protein n=1 Tax=Pseudactinotalea sp. Z1748 TaxID=3413027 RepID=UPI003C7A7526